MKKDRKNLDATTEQANYLFDEERMHKMKRIDISELLQERLQHEHIGKHHIIRCHCCNEILLSDDGHETTLESTRRNGRYIENISYKTKVCNECYKFFQILTRIKIALAIICSIISPIVYYKLDGSDMSFWIIVGYIAIGAIASIMISMPIEQIYKVIVRIFFKRDMFANR